MNFYGSKRTMPFYLEITDRDGNFGFTRIHHGVIEAKLLPGDQELKIIAPPELKFIWPTLNSKYFVEVPGPLCQLTSAEYADLLQQAGVAPALVVAVRNNTNF